MEQPQLTITAISPTVNRFSWVCRVGFYDRLESTRALGPTIAQSEWLGTGYNVEQPYVDEPVFFDVPKNGDVRFFRLVRLPHHYVYLWDTAGLIKIYYH